MNRKHVLIGILALVLPVVIVAQEMGDEVSHDAGPDPAVYQGVWPSNEGALPAGTVSCFDYYTFGSVTADITSLSANAVSGTSISFSGHLRNENPYPIVDGAFYVKIFRDRDHDGNGPDVVDQFLVQGDIAIPGNGAVPISFQWKVPSYAVSGEYKVATFFTTSRKFNLLGLSFTDDVVGNTVPFTVSGEQSTGVSFDKAGVTIAGDPYTFASFPPHVSEKEPVEITAKIVNPTGKSQRANIKWTVYQWDAQLRENAVQEESSAVVVPANSEEAVKITVRDTRYPVYLALGELRWNDSKSYIGIRFVRDNVDRTRINFPGVTTFPLVGGEETTMFSCLHNSGSYSMVKGGSLDLSITDRNGKVIHEYRYDGDITGDMMGVVSKFVPGKTYDYFTLSARLFQDGKFVDEANLVYDCKQIDEKLCVATEEPAQRVPVSGWQTIAILLFGVVVLLTGLLIYRKLASHDAPPTLSQK